MPEQLSPDQWQEVEKDVNAAEEAQRISRRASAELSKETGIPKKEREEEETNDRVLDATSTPRATEKALEREAIFAHQAKEILGSEGSPQRSLVQLRKENLIAALREEATIAKERENLFQEETAILAKITKQPTGAQQDALEEIRSDMKSLDEHRQQILESTPEGYFGLHLKELKEHKADLEIGRIVETPYVKQQAEDIVAHLRANKPVMIYGHLGTGKTELAMHVAKNYIGKEALVISGSKHTSLAELYGHQILAVDKESGATVSDFFMGPIYRAMDEGRPVIIDEVNAIPHEVLISLNHILTRQVGEKINVQQDTGRTVEIKKGFGITMTGNLNQGQERYIDRQDMDPAFLSRLYKIEHDYLPQKTEGSLEDEASQDNELFQVMLAKVMDRNGNIEAPQDTPHKLWNLAKAARVTQDVFAGREVSNAYYFQEAGGRPVRYLLKESVLSLRALDNVLNQWQKEGYKQELDYYLWKEFASQSTVASDKAYLYQMLKDRFGFFSSPGWEQNPSYGTGGVVTSFDIKPPANLSTQRNFFGPRSTIEFAYGKAPERATWPNESLLVETEQNPVNERLISLEERMSRRKERLAELGRELEKPQA